jgi:hypothetical protein
VDDGDRGADGRARAGAGGQRLARADEIRDELLAQGIVIEDTADRAQVAAGVAPSRRNLTTRGRAMGAGPLDIPYTSALRTAIV